MRTHARRRRAWAWAPGLLLVAACGERADPVPEATPYLDPGFVEAGAWRMHYALTPSRDLSADIAGSYGIEQRRNLAALVITIAPRDPRDRTPLPEADVEATAIALTGERRRLRVARHEEPGAPTWIATVELRHRVPITIEISARATPASTELRARLTREFRFD